MKKLSGIKKIEESFWRFVHEVQYGMDVGVHEWMW